MSLDNSVIEIWFVNPGHSWYRSIVWFLTGLGKNIFFFFLKGFLIYFAYGIRHSKEGHPREDDDEDSLEDHPGDDDSCLAKSATPDKSLLREPNENINSSESAYFITSEKTSEC